MALNPIAKLKSIMSVVFVQFFTTSSAAMFNIGAIQTKTVRICLCMHVVLIKTDQQYQFFGIWILKTSST